MNLEGKIDLIKTSVSDIKQAILDKNVTPSGNLSTYADAIDSIVTPNNQSKTITSNGVIRYDEGYTGLEQVTVNVNQNVQDKTITNNGIYTADNDYIGLGTVTVNVSPNVITKTITANGTYNAENDNVDGYNEVIVNVPSPINDLIDGSITSIDTNVGTIKSGAFKDCENLDTVILRSNSVVDLSDDSIFENTPIANKTGNIYVPNDLVESYQNNNKSNNPNDFLQAVENENLATQSSWRAITYGNGKFVALNYLAFVSISTDGVNWLIPEKKFDNNNNNRWVAIAYGHDIFIAFATSGRICTSENGIDWDAQTSYAVPSRNWASLTYGNSTFVALSNNGYISTSENGTTWTEAQQASGLVNGLNDPLWVDLTYDGTKFVALESYSGYVAFSFNGIDWMRTSYISGVTSDWQSLAYSNNGFIAISESGYISTSTDGLIWTTPTQNSNLIGHNWQDIVVSDGLHILDSNGYISYTNPKYNFLPISQLSS